MAVKPFRRSDRVSEVGAKGGTANIIKKENETNRRPLRTEKLRRVAVDEVGKLEMSANYLGEKKKDTIPSLRLKVWAEWWRLVNTREKGGRQGKFDQKKISREEEKSRAGTN